MKLVVISSSPFVPMNSEYAAYSPYVKELLLWAKHSDEIAFFCPVWEKDNGLLISKIPFPIAKFFIAKEFNIKTFSNFLKAFQYSFWNFYQLFQAMHWADHIHLRCPGNIGLMGCMVQVFFPNKIKTAKYAGNWDPNSKQPWSYKLQQWILSNTFLSKNMQVLVYGTWEGSSKNIKPFFTASYTEADKTPNAQRNLDSNIHLIYVGTFVKGKRPLYAIQLVEALINRGLKCTLSLYGHGKELENLKMYIHHNKLQDFIFIEGNQPHEVLKKAYQEAHFMVLPSESEGWPKVVAEAMFWGCLPIATRVSCVPNMLDNGERGVLLSMNFDADVNQIAAVFQDPKGYQEKVEKSILWSRKYTLDLFENEIKALLHS